MGGEQAAQAGASQGVDDEQVGRALGYLQRPCLGAAFQFQQSAGQGQRIAGGMGAGGVGLELPVRETADRTKAAAIGMTIATTSRPIILPPSRPRPPKPPKIAENWAIIANIEMAPASVATKAMIKVSRLPTWAISWASTPPSSCRVRMRRMPVVTATAACCGLRPVAKAFGNRTRFRTPWASEVRRGPPAP